MNIIKMSICKSTECPKQYTAQCNFYQNSNGIFHRNKTKILKFSRIHKRSQIAKEILRKKTKVGSITFFDFKLHYKAIVIKTVWYQHKKRHRSMEQNRKSRINLHIYGQQIYNEGAKNIYWGKDSLFYKTGWPHAKE